MNKYEKIPLIYDADPIQNLVKFLENNLGDKLEIDLSDRQELLEDVTKRENLVNDSSILNLLKEYGIPIESKNIFEDKETGLFHIKIENSFHDKKLPNGYAYKGGAARALLKINFLDEKNEKPRDIDIVRISNDGDFEASDNEIAKEFMPEDFEYGDGVELALDLDDYFETRDFTINEIIAKEDEIILTRQCLMDTIRHVIRITQYEFDESYSVPKYKQLTKAVRLYSEEINKYGDATIENVGDWCYEDYFISPFWMAVHLDRAFQRGYVVAKDYVVFLQNKNCIPNFIKTPEEAAGYLLDIMEYDNFYFRHAPVEQFEFESSMVDQINYYEDKYDKLKNRR